MRRAYGVLSHTIRWNDTKLCPEAQPCCPYCCLLLLLRTAIRRASHEADRSKTKCLHQWN
ncbi:hypothetical protein PSAC2689_20572 [Paraburkholderia sacchari]